MYAIRVTWIKTIMVNAAATNLGRLTPNLRIFIAVENLSSLLLRRSFNKHFCCLENPSSIFTLKVNRRRYAQKSVGILHYSVVSVNIGTTTTILRKGRREISCVRVYLRVCV